MLEDDSLVPVIQYNNLDKDIRKIVKRKSSHYNSSYKGSDKNKRRKSKELKYRKKISKEAE